MLSAALISAMPSNAPVNAGRDFSGSIDRVTVGGGGGIVGNGAGVVEFEFHQSKHIIDRVLGGCFPGNPCRLETEDSQLAEKILALVRSSAGDLIRFEFVSGKERPGFFNTGANEFHRIAKTTLTPGSPIYVNTDLLYETDGKPRLSFGQIVGLVVHELGHQTGEPDHRILDRLGSEVARMLQGQSFYYRYASEMGGAAFQLGVTNLNFPAKIPLVVLFAQDRSRNLTTLITRMVKCQKAQTQFVGYEVTNGHFSVPTSNLELGAEIDFNAWLRVSCFDSSTKTWNEETHSLKMTVDKNRDIESVNIFPIRF
jgi:hypothetical protein